MEVEKPSLRTCTSSSKDLYLLFRGELDIFMCELKLSKKGLRGHLLENRVIGAQKYRHALRENEAICSFPFLAE